jgi:uncharacterized short protein YbdD (DUF466 family)
MREGREVGSEKREALPRVATSGPFARWGQTFRQVFGMPDYDRYLEHRRQCHPGEPVLGPRAFYQQQLEQRYAGGTGRCC